MSFNALLYYKKSGDLFFNIEIVDENRTAINFEFGGKAMKWLGAMMLISTTTWLGFDLSKKFKDQTTQLRTLMQSLQILEAEINRMHLCNRIFKNISRKVDTPIQTFYERLADRLNDVVSDFIIIWNEELDFFMKRSALKPSDQEILAQFGREILSNIR